MQLEETVLWCSVAPSGTPSGPLLLKSTETPAVKKKHRRTRSGVKSHDVAADAGNQQTAANANEQFCLLSNKFVFAVVIMIIYYYYYYYYCYQGGHTALKVFEIFFSILQDLVRP